GRTMIRPTSIWDGSVMENLCMARGARASLRTRLAPRLSVGFGHGSIDCQSIWSRFITWAVVGVARARSQYRSRFGLASDRNAPKRWVFVMSSSLVLTTPPSEEWRNDGKFDGFAESHY